MNKNLPGIGILSDLMIQLDWMLKYSIIDAATWTIKTKNVRLLFAYEKDSC